MKKLLYIIFLAYCNLNSPDSNNQNRLLGTIIEQHINSLQNLDKVNPRCFIFFSATPGMGKTMIAKKLELELKAIRVTLDDGRIFLRQNSLYPIFGSDIDTMIYYLNRLLLQLKKTSKNHLIIIDDTVDSMYEYMCSIAKKFNSRTFLIKLDVSKKTAIERIKSREVNPKGYLNNIDHWYDEYLKFDQKYVDYVLDNEDSIRNLSIQPLIKLISHLLN